MWLKVVVERRSTGSSEDEVRLQSRWGIYTWSDWSGAGRFHTDSDVVLATVAAFLTYLRRFVIQRLRTESIGMVSLPVYSSYFRT
ncbi:hypothetical protein C8Q80DRAFT_1177408 [Daedaleopsis nitida]|nr:hypothetical protein C8Q80DRAFT_1177408 [Daedaleopsis nitida]